ncbi:sensor histidine kinase, partial [Cereibacter sediminicola]
ELPAEIAPVAAAVNQLLGRLNAAFEAERSFAAHAAHELRTPVAGATAQAQRIRIETSDPRVAGRAADIETTLKRLTRLSDKLMQLARAEGGRTLGGTPADLRPILSLVAQDFTRVSGRDRLVLVLPEGEVPSRIDPDAFA